MAHSIHGLVMEVLAASFFNDDSLLSVRDSLFFVCAYVIHMLLRVDFSPLLMVFKWNLSGNWLLVFQTIFLWMRFFRLTLAIILEYLSFLIVYYLLIYASRHESLNVLSRILHLFFNIIPNRTIGQIHFFLDFLDNVLDPGPDLLDFWLFQVKLMLHFIGHSLWSIRV